MGDPELNDPNGFACLFLIQVIGVFPFFAFFDCSSSTSFFFLFVFLLCCYFKFLFVFSWPCLILSGLSKSIIFFKVFEVKRLEILIAAEISKDGLLLVCSGSGVFAC